MVAPGFTYMRTLSQSIFILHLTHLPHTAAGALSSIPALCFFAHAPCSLLYSSLCKFLLYIRKIYSYLYFCKDGVILTGTPNISSSLATLAMLLFSCDNTFFNIDSLNLLLYFIIISCLSSGDNYFGSGGLHFNYFSLILKHFF